MGNYWTNKQSHIYLFIIIHCFVWWLIVITSKTNLDSYGDMLESFSWSQHFLLGSDKHPQFLPWMIGLWFKVFPQNTVSFFALSATNLAVGLLGIRALARHFLLSNQLVFLAVASAALAFPYLTLSSKLNMNAIGLATWPWAAWFLIKTLEGKHNSLKIISSIALGILSAITMMGKYHAVLLLAAFFVVTLLPTYRYCWRSVIPYVAIASFIITISPHLYWLYKNDFSTFSYASSQGSGFEGELLITFMLVPLFYWMLPLGIILSTCYSGSIYQRLLAAIKWKNASDLLWYLTTLPFIFTVTLGATGLVVLSTPWSIPLGFSFTILLVRNANKNQAAIDRAIINFSRNYYYIWILLFVLGLVFMGIEAYKEKHRHYNPTQLVSEIIVSQSKERRFPIRGAWVALGTKAAGIVFYAPKELNLEALPGYPDQLPGYYPARNNWKNEPGIILCSDSDNSCLQSAYHFAARNKIDLETSTFETHREGVRFPKEVVYTYKIFWYQPANSLPDT